MKRMLNLRKSKVLALAAAVCLALTAVVPYSPVCEPSFAAAQEGTSQVGNGNALYEPLKVTGIRMPEEQLFNNEELLRVMNGLPDLTAEVPYDGDELPQPETGISLLPFLTVCGADFDGQDARIRIIGAEDEAVISVPDLIDGRVSVVLSIPENNEQTRNAVISGPDGRSIIKDPVKIIFGTQDDLTDPMYWTHDRDPFRYMDPIVFTVNFVDRAEYSDKDDEMQPFRTVRLTLGEIEDLILEHPDQVNGNYFGMSGNEATKGTMGLGGFFDYYEGLELNWLLTEVCGLKEGEGSAVLYGRDYDRFGQIRSLDYFFPENYDDYYLELTDEYSVSGVVPVLAVSKNGCPLLPLHDHDIEGNFEYNTFNVNATAAGFSSKIGIQKNVSGPMIAALANLDGVYGGYQNETSGDCVRIDLYVDRSQYSDLEEQNLTFEDIPDGAWYEDNVKTLVQRGVVNGMTKTTFEPGSQVTRAQFVKMLACESNEALGYLPDMPFKDVSENSWCWPYVQWAYKNGIVNGTSAEEFSPNALITRQDTAVIIDRYLKYKGVDLEAGTGDKVFTDDGEISGYASAAVHLLTGRMLNGYPDGSFRPKAGATRAEAAKVLCFCLDY